MITKEISKDLAKYLSKELKSKEIKHSEILELISKFNGFKDWNTFSAISSDSVYDRSNLDWSKEEYIHVDNGGYEFSYNSKRKILSIFTGFFGCSSNTHFFSLSKNEIKEIIFDLNKMANHHDQEEETEDNLFIKKSKWTIDAFNITFISQASKVSLMRNESKEMIKILTSFISD